MLAAYYLNAHPRVIQSVGLELNYRIRGARAQLPHQGGSNPTTASGGSVGGVRTQLPHQGGLELNYRIRGARTQLAHQGSSNLTTASGGSVGGARAQLPHQGGSCDFGIFDPAAHRLTHAGSSNPNLGLDVRHARRSPETRVHTTLVKLGRDQCEICQVGRKVGRSFSVAATIAIVHEHPPAWNVVRHVCIRHVDRHACGIAMARVCARMRAAKGEQQE